jgi:hypothetical protein
VERLRYVHRGETELEGGDVQLWFGEAVVRLGSAGDGEALRIEEEPWEDPFAEPLSAENREYVASHGKWQLVDVSAEPFFADLIGTAVVEIAPLTSSSGKLVGVKLLVGTSEYDIVVEFDEVEVHRRRAGA